MMIGFPVHAILLGSIGHPHRVGRRLRRLSSNGDLDLDTGLDVNDNGLDSLSGGVQAVG